MFDSAKLMYSTGGGASFYDHPIEQSLRFNDDDSPELTRTPSSAGNRKTWTYSAWIKPSRSGSQSGVLLDNTNSSNENGAWINIDKTSGKLFYGDFGTASYSGQLELSRNMRDSSAWYHIVFVHDTTNATASDRLRWYVNGERATDISQSVYPSQNYDGRWNTTNKATIGRFTDFTGYHYDGYMAETHFIDGQALDASSFGETKSGVWIPKAYSGSYGTNGFYLDFDGTYYNDKSGNGNNFTANNLAATDVVLDSPTNNFATLNPIASGANVNLSEGNLRFKPDSTTATISSATIGMNSGKWYAEFYCTNSDNMIGLVQENAGVSDGYLGQTDSLAWGYYAANGNIYNNGGNSAYGASYTTGDLIGLLFDADAGTLTFYKNNSSQGTAVSSLTNGYYRFAIGNGNTGNSIGVFNFGQDSSFAGNKTAQGNTDANGYGDFYYAPPTGYLALCTANLTVPDAMNPALDASPQDYFNTVLWTGNQLARSIDYVGFQPDLVWCKARGAAESHRIMDSVRGKGTTYALTLTSNSTAGDAEDSLLTDITSEGFDIAAGYNSPNVTGRTYAAWNWKANGSGVSNTDGSITSTVSANTDAGFSIVSYTGNGTTGSTIGHGLGVAPAVIITKDRSNASRWAVYHHANTADPETDHLRLNETTATIDAATYWNDTAPTSTVFTVGTDASVNYNGDNHIAYCWAEVEGFSKFGSYTGNGSTDGTFCYCGFKPAFVIIKKTSAADNWTIMDTERSPYNYADDFLIANGSDAESNRNITGGIDIVSNGFKLRHTDGSVNGSGASYIFMAFSENPLKFSTAV